MDANQIQAIAAVIVALGALITALGVAVVNTRTKQVKEDVAKVHTLVNQQSTDAQIYQADLIRALHLAGVAVPLDKSLKKLKEE